MGAGWARVGRYQGFVEFGIDFGDCLCQFLVLSKMFEILFSRACFQGLFLSISDSKFRHPGLPNRGFRMKSIAKDDCSRKACFVNFGIDFNRFLKALGAVFLFSEL